MKFSYKHTRLTCYIAYVSQAAVCGLAALLFSSFQEEFSLSFGELSLIVVVNFCCQMGMDLLAANCISKVGYRAGILFSSGMVTVGLLLLGVLPYAMNPFFGILIAVGVYSLGGGLIDVIVSAVVELIPSDHKAAQMSLLHSFFCWGTVFVILFSTGYFALFSTQNWRYLPMILAAIPAATILLFALVPLPAFSEEARTSTVGSLFRTPVFYVLVALMLFAGACEQLMSQWASFFAEQGLGVSKALGDLLGPCTFAVLMGLARILFALKGQKFSLKRTISVCGALCVGCYALTVFAPHPLLSLVGCALTGFAIAMMWPGCVSIAAKRLPTGGPALFAMLALFGDVGCTLGPVLVGLVSDGVEAAGGGVFSRFLSGSVTEVALKAGILVGIVFPLVLCLLVQVLRKVPKDGVQKEGEFLPPRE